MPSPIETADMRIHGTGPSAVAEFRSSEVLLRSAADARDLWLRAWGKRVECIALHEANIAPEFFDLRTGLAGDVLQKLVNYRARLVVIGDISRYLDRSESLRALVRESNRGRDVRFVGTMEEIPERP
jgi:hypothetical protein